MAVLQEMYKILEEMIDCTKQDDAERVSGLNKSFEVLFSQMYPNPKTELGLLYDNCRQSCVMAERMKNLHQEFLNDAIERFSKIPKPG